MKVSAFTDQYRDEQNFTVNCVFGFKGYRTPPPPQGSYSVHYGNALYLVGGRASIKEHCQKHPFLLAGSNRGPNATNQFYMMMARGVPGLSESERKRLNIEKEPFLASAMGIFRKKMLTVVQIRQGIAMGSGGLTLTSPCSNSIPDLIDLHDATQVMGILAQSTGNVNLIQSAVDRRTLHNLKHNQG